MPSACPVATRGPATGSTWNHRFINMNDRVSTQAGIDVDVPTKLAELPIVGDVDTRFGLLAYDPTYGSGELISKFRILWATFWMRLHRSSDLFGSLQAPDMRGQDAFAASNHCNLPMFIEIRMGGGVMKTYANVYGIN